MSIDTRAENGNFTPAELLSPEHAHAEFLETIEGLNLGEKYQMFLHSGLDQACVAAIDTLTYGSTEEARAQFQALTNQARDLTDCIRYAGQADQSWLDYAFPSTATMEIDPDDPQMVAFTLHQNHFVSRDRVRMSEEATFRVSRFRGIPFAFSSGKIEPAHSQIQGHTRVSFSNPEHIGYIKDWVSNSGIIVPERRYFFFTRE